MTSFAYLPACAEESDDTSYEPTYTWTDEADKTPMIAEMDTDAEFDTDTEFGTDTDIIADDSASFDIDGDGVADSDDNCPRIPNPGQEDEAVSEPNGVGDACDDDHDGDGIINFEDVCPTNADLDPVDCD